jgi:murein DD-endopeptidase MepM/ murein hydrolase activator NlpD
LELNKKSAELGASFEKSEGRLPWPVDNGIVKYHYGVNKFENTTLTFDSPGITIATPSEGSPVKAVFGGEITAVNGNGDGSSVIVIRHGKYFTVYSNLWSVSVSRGNTIKMGEVIGKVGRDDEGTGGQIDFILMMETKNINPEPWLHR